MAAGIPRDMGPTEVEAFLTHLAVEARVAASTQNQALQALLFLYRQVLDIDLPWLENVTRASRPKRLPVVLSAAEVRSVLAQLDGTSWLIANLLYGSGLRLMEAHRLRVKDLVLEGGELIVRDAKGGKDRVTVLPAAIARKYPKAATEWGWQWVFPANSLCRDVYTGLPTRHHQHEKIVQRAVQAAVHKARILQPASCHTFRHCFATHLLQAGCDIRTCRNYWDTPT